MLEHDVSQAESRGLDVLQVLSLHLIRALFLQLEDLFVEHAFDALKRLLLPVLFSVIRFTVAALIVDL